MHRKLKQFVLSLFLLNSAASASDISQLDGEWYSQKWQYGYTLKNGRGIATITNSPLFIVGQEIVSLTAVGNNSFVGKNIYKDGAFYKVKATLQPNGKLLFEGEKKAKWEMERVDSDALALIKKSKLLPEKMFGNYYLSSPSECNGIEGFETLLQVAISNVSFGSISSCFIEKIAYKGSYLEVNTLCSHEGGEEKSKAKLKIVQPDKNSITVDGSKYKRCK